MVYAAAVVAGFITGKYSSSIAFYWAFAFTDTGCPSGVRSKSSQWSSFP